MKILLSGITRSDRLSLMRRSGVRGIVLDFSLAKTLSPDELESVRADFEWILLDYDLSGSFSRYKSLWFGEPTKKQLGSASTVGEARERALDKLTNKVQEYASFVEDNPDLFDVYAIPFIEAPHDREWEKLLKSKRGMYTLTDLSQLEGAISTYSYVGLSSSLDQEDVDCAIKPLMASLRSSSCLLHRWGRVDKETALKGVFWSASSSNWITGSKYGNTYEYVGNLKLTLHNSKSKKVRVGFKSRCATFGIEHEDLLNDDKEAVNLWNIHQWRKYAEDSEKLKGYWSEHEVSDQPLVKVGSNSLAPSSGVVSYSRACNSCFLSSQCPVYLPDSDCRVSTLQTVETPDDIQDLLNKVIQIQGDRVMFSAFAEKVQNAGINPEVSRELETLTKLMKDAREITAPAGEDEVFIKAKGSGVISRLFGGYGRSGGGSKPSTPENIIDVSALED